MSLRFRYQHFPASPTVHSLLGTNFRSRPVIYVGLIGPLGTKVVDALIDSGADDTVFPESAATTIGIDLSNAPTLASQGIGGPPLVIRFAQVTLRIADNQEYREWMGWVGFSSTLRRQGLLGTTGFLQFFDLILRSQLEESELSINSLYPGK